MKWVQKLSGLMMLAAFAAWVIMAQGRDRSGQMIPLAVMVLCGIIFAVSTKNKEQKSDLVDPEIDFREIEKWGYEDCLILCETSRKTVEAIQQGDVLVYAHLNVVDYKGLALSWSIQSYGNSERTGDIVEDTYIPADLLEAFSPEKLKEWIQNSLPWLLTAQGEPFPLEKMCDSQEIRQWFEHHKWQARAQELRYSASGSLVPKYHPETEKTEKGKTEKEPEIPITRQPKTIAGYRDVVPLCKDRTGEVPASGMGEVLQYVDLAVDRQDRAVLHWSVVAWHKGMTDGGAGGDTPIPEDLFHSFTPEKLAKWIATTISDAVKEDDFLQVCGDERVAEWIGCRAGELQKQEAQPVTRQPGKTEETVAAKATEIRPVLRMGTPLQENEILVPVEFFDEVAYDGPRLDYLLYTWQYILALQSCYLRKTPEGYRVFTCHAIVDWEDKMPSQEKIDQYVSRFGGTDRLLTRKEADCLHILLFQGGGMIPLEKVTTVSRATLRYGIDGNDHVCLHEGTAYRKGNILHNAARYGFVFTREEAQIIKKQNEQARARALIENRKNAELWKKKQEERKKADEQFRSMLKDAIMVAEVYRVRHETGLHDYEEESVLLYRSAQGKYALVYSFDPAPGGYGDKCIEQLSAFVDVDQAEDNKAIAAEVRDRTGFMTQLLKAL